MSYTVRLTTWKPEGARWFSEADPEKFAAYVEWATSIPGIVNVRQVSIDENTIVRQYTFVDEAASIKYRELHDTNPLSVARNIYNRDNGIRSEYELIPNE